MENETLLEHIERAREELLAVQNLDAEDRELVGQLMTEVVAHMTEADSDEANLEHLSGRLKTQVMTLEVNHPKLASMIDRISNLLSSLGI